MMAGNASYDGPGDLPLEIPLFPLSGALLLPRGLLPLIIFEPRYLAMIDAALTGDRLIGMIQPRIDHGDRVEEGAAALCDVGCVGRITAFAETGDGRYQVTLTGVSRFRLLREVNSGRLYRSALVEWPYASDFVTRAGEDEVDRAELLRTFEAYLAANDLETDWEHVEKASTESLVNTLSMMSPYGPREKQALLEAPDLKTRAATLVAITEMSLRRGGPSGESPVLN